jgi:hypothetical protein
MEDSFIEMKSVIRQIDINLNIETTEADRHSNTIAHHEYGDLSFRLCEIEKMVRDIEATEEPGFLVRREWSGRCTVQPLALARKHYGNIRAFLNGYLSTTVYSLRVAAFYNACDSLGMLNSTFILGKPGMAHGDFGQTFAELFNSLIKKVRETCRSSVFKERLRYREDNAKRNEAKGLALEAKMFGWQSRHLILMLHLGYELQHRKSITLSEIQQHRDRFFNNRHMNGLLRGIQGFIWKLEEGADTGLHLHVLLFYTAKSRADVYIAQQIGEYWKTVVTKGKGSYWNSNAQKREHRLFGHGIGTGMIDRTDTEKREALRENIRYLAKADQFLLMKCDQHTRTFATGQVKAKKKLGRPRIKQPACDVTAATDKQAISPHRDLFMSTIPGNDVVGHGST